MTVSVELWELKIGDRLDFHVVWQSQLLGGYTIATQDWQIVSPANIVIIEATGKNAGDRKLDRRVYPANTVSTAWITSDPLAQVGDVVLVQNEIITNHAEPRRITADRYIEIVELYSHERADPPGVRPLSDVSVI